MDPVELRDPDAARTWVLDGLWLSRAARPQAATVRVILDWCLEIASNGSPLLPVGVVADMGLIAFGLDREGNAGLKSLELPGWPATLLRGYEDHFLGRLYGDYSFERASDALRRYTGRDQARGLDYVVRQFRDRAKLGGVLLSPAVLRGLQGEPPDALLSNGFESLSQSPPAPLLIEQYERLVSAMRRLAEVLGPEDLIALEQRTAVAEMGQYVAHRQILQLTARIESTLPTRMVPPAAGRKEVPTRVLDEDQYPVGGYTSIATKGSIESLLHSQLAFMEPERPDLFDMKFVRDELFYYSRDENQFLRRRRTVVFAFSADLVGARYKDVTLPAQRIVFVLAATLALVRKLMDWLSTDALQFEFVFLKGSLKDSPLSHERELLELLLRETFERGAARSLALPDAAALGQHLTDLAHESQVYCLQVAQTPDLIDAEQAVLLTLTADADRPRLADASQGPVELAAADPADQWAEVVLRTLAHWV